MSHSARWYTIPAPPIVPTWHHPLCMCPWTTPVTVDKVLLLWQLIRSYTYTVHKLLDKYRHTVKSKGDLGKGRNVSSTSQHGVLVLLPRPILQSFFLSSRDFAAGMSASFSSFLGSVATARRMASHIPPINTAQNKFSNGAKGSWIPSRRAESLKYTKKMTTPK